LHLIRVLSRRPRISNDTWKCMRAVLRDPSRAQVVREQAARCVGRHARSDDVSFLESVFLSTVEHDLMRALLAGMREAGVNRSYFAQISRSHPALAGTCAYLQTPEALPVP
jgi:hypothetical protein